MNKCGEIIYMFNGDCSGLYLVLKVVEGLDMLYVKFLRGQRPKAVEGLVLVPELPTDSFWRTSQTHTNHSKHLDPTKTQQRNRR